MSHRSKEFYDFELKLAKQCLNRYLFDIKKYNSISREHQVLASIIKSLQSEIRKLENRIIR